MLITVIELVFLSAHCCLVLRSPEVSTGGSPEPLSNRVQSRLDLLKPKVKWAPVSKSLNRNHHLVQIESEVQTLKMSSHPVISLWFYLFA